MDEKIIIKRLILKLIVNNITNSKAIIKNSFANIIAGLKRPAEKLLTSDVKFLKRIGTCLLIVGDSFKNASK